MFSSIEFSLGISWEEKHVWGSNRDLEFFQIYINAVFSMYVDRGDSVESKMASKEQTERVLSMWALTSSCDLCLFF